MSDELLSEITPPLFATEIDSLRCDSGSLSTLASLHNDGYRLGCVTNTLADTRGAWALQAHTRARAEWRLTGVHEGKLANIAIDRTFVDANNVRWIIDFKTGSHDGGDVEAFLDNEQSRYRAQLDVYAAVLSALNGESQPREIRLGLYFPMLKGWREWEWRAPESR